MNTKMFLKDCMAHSFLDNQHYLVNEKLINISGHQPLEICCLKNKGGHFSNKKIFQFLQRCSTNLSQQIYKDMSCIVFFNEREYEHNTHDAFITIKGDTSKFTIQTGNLIGCVSHNGYYLKIGSRFGDKFLKYIVLTADGFLAVPETGSISHKEEGYDWLINYLWSMKLKKAFRLGLPKSYQKKEENLRVVRGQINPLDYTLNKSTGKYLCSYYEHSYANLTVELIATTYQYLKGRKNNSFLQNERFIYNTFLIASQGQKRKIDELLRTKHVKNPYYNDYNDVIDLSKIILNGYSADFTLEKKSSGYFFDISMLFEYFIKKLLIHHGIVVRNKFQNRHSIPTCGLRKNMMYLEPDIVFEKEDKIFIFDVKYKHFNFNEGVKREDLFQLHTYLSQYSNGNGTIGGCGFIYPLTESFEKKESSLIENSIMQSDKQIPFYILFVCIPQEDEPNFVEEMDKRCSDFINNIKNNVMKI